MFTHCVQLNINKSFSVHRQILAPMSDLYTSEKCTKYRNDCSFCNDNDSKINNINHNLCTYRNHSSMSYVADTMLRICTYELAYYVVFEICLHASNLNLWLSIVCGSAYTQY